MSKRKKFFMNRSKWSMLLLGAVVAAATLVAAGDALAQEMDQAQSHAAHAAASSPAKLVDIVRLATRQYIDVNVAAANKYAPAFGCVTSPQEGAMGIHYINGGLVQDGVIDGNKPEALIYEPWKGGLRLVGVEYIVDAATWMSHNSAPPVLEGQAFQFVSAPNRYGLPAFFELHVWAWRDNPQGAFVDWNNRVTCEGQ
jgi:hypothetical protein